MSFEQIIEEIDTFPPFPESVQKIESAFAKGEVEPKLIIKLIESDAILTAEILARANSPMNGFRKDIVSVSQAVTLLGNVKIRAFVLEFAMKKNFKVDMSVYGIDNSKFSDVSNLQSTLMFQWYMGVDINLSKLLVPIIFLLDIGKVLIANEITSSAYAAQFTQEMQECDDVEALEMMFSDTNSYKVSALLFKHWNFNELFIDLANELASGSSMAELKEALIAIKAVRLAVNIKEQLSENSLYHAQQFLLHNGKDAIKFEKVCLRIKSKLEE